MSERTVTITGTGPVTLTASQAAYGEYAAGSTSVTFTVSSAPASLTLAAIPTQVFGVAPFVITSKSVSPAPITYEVTSGPATLLGSMLTVVGSGTVTISAVQSATADYLSQEATESFSVSPADPVLTINNTTQQTFGAKPFQLEASSSSQAPIRFSVLSGPASVNGATVSFSGTGKVIIEANQTASQNYNAASTTQVFTVLPALSSLTLNAIAQQRYGTAPFAVSASSLSPSAITYAIASGNATISGSVLSVTGTGMVVVTATQAPDVDYAGATTSISFLVTPGQANLVLAPIGTQNYGNAPLSLAASSDSPAGITYSVVSGPASLSGNLLTITGTGMISVEADQPATADYASQSSFQSFIVKPAVPGLNIIPVTSHAYDPSPITVKASSTSPEPISFSILSGPATILGNQLTMTGAGEVVIGATQVSDANYASQEASTSFVVTLASPQLSIKDIGSQIYGTVPPLLLATSNSSAAITYGVVRGPALLSGPSTVSLTGTGSVTVSASQSATTQYAAQTVTSSFLVTAGNPGLHFSHASTQMFGTQPIQLLATALSSGTIRYSVISGPGSIINDMLTLQGAGAIVVSASVDSDMDYASAVVTEVVSVLPAPSSLSFKAIDPQKFGNQPFSITATSNSPAPITYAVTTGPASIVGTTVSITGIGTVTLTATQDSAANYLSGIATTTFTVEPAKPGLVLEQIPQKVFGASPFTITATSASQAPITYSVSAGPAIVTGNTVQVTGAGSITIVASQAASIDYEAQSVCESFLVLPATPQLTVTPVPSVTYGAQPIFVTTSSLSPAPVTLAIVSGPASLMGNILTITGVGNVVLTASQTAGVNYTAQTVTVTIPVAAASAPISLQAIAEQTFGAPPLQLHATSASPAPITYALISGPASLAGNSLSFTGAGTVIVTASQDAIGNYTAQQVTASIEVGRASPHLTIAAVASHVLGDAPFALTPTSNSDAPIVYSVLSGGAAFTGNMLTLTQAGAVSVCLSQAENANYMAQSVTTTFVVTANSITISPSAASLNLNQSLHFSVNETSTSPLTGAWVVIGGTSNGSIDQNGLYTAPPVLPTPSEITLGYVINGGLTSVQLQLLPAIPTVTSLTPNHVSALSTMIEVTGSNFLPSTTILVDGSPVATTFRDGSHVSFTAALASPTNTLLTISAIDPTAGPVASASLQLSAIFPTIQADISIIPLGNVQLQLSGMAFTPSSTATLNGRLLSTTVNADKSLNAVGYMPPWSTGTAIIQVFGGSDGQALSQLVLPVKTRAVAYDTAARFATQAAFGPNPDLVEHIQTIGLNAFLDEQMALPGADYSSRLRTSYMLNALTGSSLLRQRVAWAFQNFIVSQAWDGDADEVSFVTMMEKDAFGNFRQMLTDITGDPSLGRFLNLGGNAYSADPSSHPNQNFAREVLQLFTMGSYLLNDDGTVKIDASGAAISAYDDSTVAELSRALTGWVYPRAVNPATTDSTIDFSLPLVAYEPNHDPGPKTLFGSIQLPARQSTESDRTKALDAIFAQPNLPPYLSRLLIQHLVKSSPSGNYVNRISKVFEDNGQGVRGDLGAVVRAILMDSEARAGDSSPEPTDGFVQEPLLFQMFAMNALQTQWSDDTIQYLPGTLGENYWHSSTVFGFYDPTYRVPGTNINSPEFMLLNNVSIIQRNAALWGMLEGGLNGFVPNETSWLYSNFTSVPQIVDALNHLTYHGQMPQAEQDSIINYCSQAQVTAQEKLHRAAFLALSGDAFTVVQ